MSDPNETRDQSSIDTGQPISELALLSESPSATFLTRVQNSIRRRVSAAETVDFTVNAFFQTFMEYLTMVFSVFGASRGQEGKRD